MPSKTAAIRRSHGFTTIELMVAIAIILVLMGIVVFGYRRVTIGAQQNQTRTILERLRNMQGTATGNKLASEKFFQLQIPAVYAYPIQGGSEAVAGSWWEAVRADSETRRDLSPNRYDDSLYRTALVLNALAASPEGRGIFDELPTNRKQLMHFDRANDGRIVASGGANILSIAMPLDAWGNPIYFVFDNWQQSAGNASRLRTLPAGGPTGGLTNMRSVSTKVYWQPVNQPTVAGTLIYMQPSVADGYPTTPIDTAYRSPDRQPFWVSAGPDGSFQTHDDNVYSFDN